MLAETSMELEAPELYLISNPLVPCGPKWTENSYGYQIAEFGANDCVNHG